MIAFAANSLLCRLALKSTGIDAATFTTVRLISGAVMLWLILQARRTKRRPAGSWGSALALFVVRGRVLVRLRTRLPTAVGALILFGSVQATMIGYGLFAGEKLRGWQSAGLCLAAGGLVWLLLPGLSAPPAGGAALMACAGVAWGIYSLRGRGAVDATATTAGNFLRAVPLAGLLSVAMFAEFSWRATGVWYAVGSGAVTSGLGYVIWYSVLPRLKATNAAIIQLSVPVLAAAGGVGLLGEPMTLRRAGQFAGDSGWHCGRYLRAEIRENPSNKKFDFVLASEVLASDVIQRLSVENFTIFFLPLADIRRYSPSFMNTPRLSKPRFILWTSAAKTLAASALTLSTLAVVPLDEASACRRSL